MPVPGDLGLIGFHTGAVLTALAAALYCPLPGQAALMVPLGRKDLAPVLEWAEQEDAALLALDSASGRVVARMTSHHSLLKALGAGILPIKVRTPGCGGPPQR